MHSKLYVIERTKQYTKMAYKSLFIIFLYLMGILSFRNNDGTLTRLYKIWCLFLGGK